jgi:hypothetical protein
MRQIVEVKSVVESKTFWVNVVVIAVSMLTFFLDHELVRNNVDLVRYGTIAIGMLNIVLRFLTTQPMRFSTQQKDN